MGTLLVAPALILKGGPRAGKVFEIRQALRIGRHPYNDVALADASVSRYHCWIKPGDTGCFVEDLASTNGTYVNGQRVQIRRHLRPGDTLTVGATRFVFSEGE